MGYPDICFEEASNYLKSHLVGVDIVSTPKIVSVRDSTVDKIAFETSHGHYSFYVRSHFSESTLFMEQVLRDYGWPVASKIHLPESIMVSCMDHKYLVTPEITCEGGSARNLIEQLSELSDDEYSQQISKLVADLIAQFDLVRPSKYDYDNEWRDFSFIRHASSDEWSHEIIASMVQSIGLWKNLTRDINTGLTPRDYYRNILIGHPLFVPSQTPSLTMIDYGESYKQMPAAERFAQFSFHFLKTQAQFHPTTNILGQIFMNLVQNGCDMRPYRLYLGLWGMRWSDRSYSLSRFAPLVSDVISTETLTDLENAIQACSDIIRI